MFTVVTSGSEPVEGVGWVELSVQNKLFCYSQGLLRLAGQLDENEIGLRVEIVFTGFINHPEITFFFRFFIWHDMRDTLRFSRSSQFLSSMQNATREFSFAFTLIFVQEDLDSYFFLPIPVGFISPG